MPSFDVVCRRLFGQSGWMSKALWGGALMFIPLINFIAFGYLLEYALRLNRGGDWELPEWREFALTDLFVSGLRFMALFAAFFALPAFVGWLAGGILDLLTFGLLGVLSYLPLAMGAFAGTLLFTVALCIYARDGMFADAWNLREVFWTAMKSVRWLAIPALAFWGLQVLGLPLYGFAFFLGIWLLIAYSGILFAGLEAGRHLAP